MTRIVLPERMTIEDTSGLLKALDGVDADGPLTLDASGVRRLDPLSGAIVAMLVALRVTRGRSAPRWVRPKDPDVRRYVRETHFERWLADPSGNGQAVRDTVEMRRLFALDPLYIARFAELLSRSVPGWTEEASFLVSLCLTELLQNVFEHAYPDRERRLGCFIQSRWYKEKQNLRLAIVDAGIGIPAALRRGKVQGLHIAKESKAYKNDAEIIVRAVEQRGLTSRVARPGGLGLKTIHGALEARDGSLTIVSHQAKVIFKRGRHTLRATPLFKGTAIELDFRPLVEIPAQSIEIF